MLLKKGDTAYESTLVPLGSLLLHISLDMNFCPRCSGWCWRESAIRVLASFFFPFIKLAGICQNFEIAY